MDAVTVAEFPAIVVLIVSAWLKAVDEDVRPPLLAGGSD